MLDSEDIEAIADAVDRGVTRSRNKFLGNVFRTLLGLGVIVAVPVLIYQWGGTVLALMLALLSMRR